MMMSSGKFVEFLKRWRALEVARKDLDYTRSIWARDVRAEFHNGKLGDAAFGKWCRTELALTEGQIVELLERARSVAVVPDEKTWTFVGGYKAVRQIYVLPPKERVAILEASKASGKSVRTVLAERRLGVSPIPRTGVSIKRETPERIDAEILAAWIERTCKNVPRHIAQIVNRYRQPARQMRSVA